MTNLRGTPAMTASDTKNQEKRPHSDTVYSIYVSHPKPRTPENSTNPQKTDSPRIRVDSEIHDASRRVHRQRFGHNAAATCTARIASLARSHLATPFPCLREKELTPLRVHQGGTRFVQGVD